MSTGVKRLLTRQETINNYKSPSKTYHATASQMFGLIPETNFSKLQLPPKVLLWISSYNLYASSDEKFFYLFDKTGKIKNSASYFDTFHIPSILTFTYIDKYHCFAIVSTDLKLMLVSVLLDLWKTVNLSARINHIEYYNNLIFLGGTSKITVMNLNCDTKYEIEKSLLLDPDRGFVNFKADIIKELNFSIKWIKGMKVFRQYDVLLAWSECTVVLVSLPGCNVRAEGDDLCPGTLITECAYTGPQDYVIAATTQGSVYIYKVANMFKLVHIFQSHTRSVPSITLINSMYFLTASMDYTVKMWSLEHFRLLYTFDMPVTDSPLGYLNFLDQATLAYTTKSQLYIAYLNLVGKMSFISVSAVKVLKMIDEKVAAVGEDNSVVLYDKGKVVTTIYPPPSAHDLKDIMFLEESRRVLVLLDSGVICLYSIQGETGLLERMIRTGDITDAETRPVQSPVQCIKQVQCIPPQYDCELVFRKHLPAEEIPQNKFLSMAAGKGILLFVNIDKIDKIYSRFAVHRETITVIEEIPGFILTLCAANVLIISTFKDNTLSKCKRIELKAQVSYLRGLEPDKFFISFNNGQSEIVQLIDNGLFRVINKEADSDILITTIDVVQENSILATAYNNNLLQIWTFDKQLLHEIKYPHPIESLLIVNETVIVSYKQITTSIKVHKTFPPGVTEIEEINEDYFKFMFQNTNLGIEKVPSPLLRDYTPEKSAFSSKVFDIKDKPWPVIVKKKKAQQKKPKKKRREVSKQDGKRRNKFGIDEKELAEYRKVISQKIPVLTGRRPISHNTLLTRRQLTEEKIIENVRRYGDPADRIDYTGLCVVDESLYYEELAKLRGSNSIL